jgi:hypothetical protein
MDVLMANVLAHVVTHRTGELATAKGLAMIVVAIPMIAMDHARMVCVQQSMPVTVNLTKEMVYWVIVVKHPRIVLLRVKQANVVTPNSHVLHP